MVLCKSTTGYLLDTPLVRRLPIATGVTKLRIGAIARPDEILFAADLPKTRSGKIMRRPLRDIAEGKALGDTTTLADPDVLAPLRGEYESFES